MELKDMVLSTLAEMEDDKAVKRELKRIEIIEDKSIQETKPKPNKEPEVEKEDLKVDDESLYLNSIRERILVLFEGFQAPNNTDIEAKVDMTLNFLEYTLATIDSRIEKLKREDK